MNARGMGTQIVHGILGFMGVFVLALPVLAYTPRSGSTVAISETLQDDLYLAGGTVAVTAAVDGDVVAAGGTLDLDGRVTGEILAAGGTVKVGAPVGRSVRAAGGTLSIDAPVGGDAVLAGGTVDVGRAAQIGKDLVAGGQSVSVLGTVGRNALIAGGSVVLAGSIRGDADIKAARIVLLPAARIGGRLRYTSDQPVDIQAGAQVAGGVERVAGVSPPRRPVTSPFGPRLRFWIGVWEVVGLLAVGVVTFAVAPRGAATVAQEVRERFWRSLLTGFVLLVTVPVAAVLVLFTVAGIPLSVIGVLLYLATLYPGLIFVAVWLGGQILQKLRKTPGGPSVFWSLAVGVVVLALLFAVPVAGWAMRLVAILVGFGALWATVWKTVHLSTPEGQSPVAAGPPLSR